MGDAGVAPAPIRSPEDRAGRRRILSIGAAGILALAGAALAIGLTRPELLSRENINSAYRILLLLVIAGFFGRLFLSSDWTRGERQRLVVIVILFAAAAVFWGVFEQAGSTLTIFADGSTENSLLGYGFASSWWQSVNALLIVLIAPFFSWLWIRLGPRDPTYATKFAIGLVFAGLGFLWLAGGASAFTESWASYVASHRDAILAAAAQHGVSLDPSKIDVSHVNEILAQAGQAGVADVTTVLPAWDRVGVHWLFGVYLMHSIGELCLSPVGLSAMTRLAPARVVGQMMGVWFLALSIGNFLGGSVSGYYEQLPLPLLLAGVAGSAFVMAALMFLLVKPIKKMLASAEVEARLQEKAA
jgi:POT family proton-dependent oligopeptide transporter